MDELLNGAQADDTPAATETHSDEPESKADEAKAADAKDEGETETEQDAEGDEPEGDEDDDDADRRPRKRTGVQRLKDRLARIEAENAQLRSRAPAPPDANDSAALARAIQAEIGPPPQEKDFPDYLAYERAMSAWQTEAVIVKREVMQRSHQAGAQEQQRIMGLVEAFEDGQDAAREAIPDYDAVLRSAKSVQVAKHVELAVLESDKSALLAYHLAKRPKEVERLNGLPPNKVEREIGRIEARLSLPTPNKQTKAPPPVTTPRGAVTPPSESQVVSGILKKFYGPNHR